MAGKLKMIRYVNGYTLKMMGNVLKVEGSTIFSWEQKKNQMNSLIKQVVTDLWLKLPLLEYRH